MIDEMKLDGTVILAVFPDWSDSPRAQGGWVRQVTDEGVPSGPTRWVGELASSIRDLAGAHRGARWLWPSTATCYPFLLGEGIRLARCHDVALTAALLSAVDGRTEPRPVVGLTELVRAYVDQRERCAAVPAAGRLRTLIAAESAAALAALEIRQDQSSVAKPGWARLIASSDAMEPRMLATEWSLVTLARVRLALAGTGATLVSYRPGRLVVRCQESQTSAMGDIVQRAGEEARRLLCPEPVTRYPFEVSVVA